VFSDVLLSDAVLACFGVRVFFRGAVAVFLLLVAFFEAFLAAGFFLTAFFLTPVVLPRVLRALVLATFFLVLRFFAFDGVASVAFFPVVLLMFVQGDP
jgi:hypothetical protein